MWSILGLAAGGAGVAVQGRDKVFVERERHANVRKGDLSYPVRAVRTDDWLYIRNFRPERWPAGDPEMYFAVGPYGDIDGGLSKTLLLARWDNPVIGRFFGLATAKRPAEELYDLKTDPGQLMNVAADPGRSEAKARLRRTLDEWMRTTGDPRDDRRRSLGSVSVLRPARESAGKVTRVAPHGTLRIEFATRSGMLSATAERVTCRSCCCSDP
jgi:N-sulfoglucosamine sulfohydrolase